MLILGIDHGNKITGYGYINLDLDTREFTYVDHDYIFDSKVSYPVSLNFIYNRVKQVIRGRVPDVAVVEAPKHNRGFKSSQKQVELLGSIKQLLIAHNIPFVEMAPSSMKLLVTGFGHASKEEVARVLSDRFNIPIERLAHIEYYNSGKKEGQIKSYSWDGTDALGLALSFPAYILRGDKLDYKGVGYKCQSPKEPLKS